MSALAEFTTDGCSDGGLSKLFACLGEGVPGLLEMICVLHDRAYWRGGSAADRLAADRNFHDSIAMFGYPIIAFIYYHSVRLGGVPWLPTSWRWGYGRPFWASMEFHNKLLIAALSFIALVLFGLVICR